MKDFLGNEITIGTKVVGVANNSLQKCVVTNITNNYVRIERGKFSKLITPRKVVVIDDIYKAKPFLFI